MYHGSAHKNIEELEPKNQSVRDLEEGEVIFATPDLALATIFMINSRFQTGSGKFNDVAYCYIVSSREEFIEKDKGGHIYVLPSDSFENDPHKGLGFDEWTSKQKVKPVKTIEYDSTLNAMIENGVQVYFVDESTHTRIEQSEDHGNSILSELESENQRRGINIKKL